MADPKQPQPVPTLAGQNLLGKTQAGKVLNFTRVGLGAGDVGAPYESATDIVDQRIGAAITSKTVNGGECTIEYAWSNAELETGFLLSELVLFAEDPDTAEELAYVYVHFPEGARPYIPATGGTTVVEAVEAIIAIVAGADPALISATINESLIYATREWTRNLVSGPDAGHGSLIDADMVDGVHLLEIVRPGDVKIVLDDTPPDGWLELDGAEYLIADYQALYDRAGAWLLPGADGDHFRLLDMRGETLRGWDNGRGIDAGRVLGSAQADAIGLLNATNGATTNSVLVSTARRAQQPATDSLDGLASGSFFGDADASSVSRANGGGRFAAETRMRNVAFMFCIRY